MGGGASGCIEAGGQVLGIIPTFMRKWEVGRIDGVHEIEVDGMHTRKAMMYFSIFLTFSLSLFHFPALFYMCIYYLITLLITITVFIIHTYRFEKSDAFVVLPGGVGTLEEVIEIITWKQLQRH